MKTVRHYSTKLVAVTPIELPVDRTIFHSTVTFYREEGNQIRLWCLVPPGDPELERCIIHDVPLNAGLSIKVLHTDAPLKFLGTWTDGPDGNGPLHAIFLEGTA